LSSGYCINKSGDDAAGLVISENLRVQIRSFGQAKRNANDGVSMLQVVEGAMNEVSNILMRMREFSVQASNDMLVARDRSFLNSEYSALKGEIDRIFEVTEFNGQYLINGVISALGLDFQVGIENSMNDRITITLADIDTSLIGSLGNLILSLM
jgi:flagellin